MSTATYSGVRPFMSQALGLAPLSSRNIAMSKLLVVERIDQRSDAIRIGLVDVGARLDDGDGAAVAAGAGGVQQRGEAAGLAELRARLGGHLARPVVELGAHV